MKMDVTNQFKQVGSFLAQDRAIPAVEKRPVTPVAIVIGHSIAGEEPVKKTENRALPSFQQEVNLSRHQGPRVAGGGSLF